MTGGPIVLTVEMTGEMTTNGHTMSVKMTVDSTGGPIVRLIPVVYIFINLTLVFIKYK